jgi:peptide/nickel transport system substrate-binding protein
MRMAIDVDSISSTVWHGFAKPIWTEFFREPYVCNIPRPKYDPVGAKALLDEAGWVDDGSGVRKCKGCQTAEDGTPLSMEMITYAEYGEPLELSQQLIGEMLAAVGIQTKLSIVQGSVLWAAAADGGIEQNGDFDIDLYDDGYAGVDPTDFIWQYYYSEAAQPDYGWNIGRWSNAEFDALLDEAYTLDEARRKEVFCQMAEMLDKELPQILLFSTINADAYSDRLSGIQSNINNVVSWNVADWKLVK